MTKNPEITEKRREQLRKAQQRRRIQLAEGDRHQVNIYLSKLAISTLDEQADRMGLDRHTLVEKLIFDSSKSS